MLNRLGPLPRFLLGLVGLLVLLAVTAALWWWLPAWPRATGKTPVPCIAMFISDDERAILTVHPMAYVLWDALSGQQRHRLDIEDPHAEMMLKVGLRDFATWLAPDGQTVAFVQSTAGRERKYNLWRPTSTPETMSLPENEIPLAFTADSQMLVTAPSLRYWDTATGKLRHSLESPGREPVAKLLTDGRRRVVAVRQDESLTVWDLNQRCEVLHLPGYELSRKNYTSRAALLSADGQRLVTAGDGRLSVWDLTRGDCLGHIATPEKERFMPRYLSPDGTRLIIDISTKIETGLEDIERLLQRRKWRVAVWDVAGTPREIGSLEDQVPVTFSPDSQWIYVSSGGKWGNWRWLDSTTLQPGTGEDPAGFSFAPDLQMIAQQVNYQPGLIAKLLGRKDTEESAVKIWERTTGREVSLLPAPGCKLFRYFPGGKQLVVWQADGTMRVWDLPPRRPWWIDYGLPVVFALLVLLGVRLVWRAFRKPAEATPC